MLYRCGSRVSECLRCCYGTRSTRQCQNLSTVEREDDIERLAEAYEEALRALHISDRDDPINQIIAQRIIEGARTGVRDPGDLCKMAIKDLMVP